MWHVDFAHKDNGLMDWWIDGLIDGSLLTRTSLRARTACWEMIFHLIQSLITLKSIKLSVAPNNPLRQPSAQTQQQPGCFRRAAEVQSPASHAAEQKILLRDQYISASKSQNWRLGFIFEAREKKLKTSIRQSNFQRPATTNDYSCSQETGTVWLFNKGKEGGLRGFVEELKLSCADMTGSSNKPACY